MMDSFARLFDASHFMAGGGTEGVGLTVVWPPTGIALAVFLVLGYRVWPGIFLGAFRVNLTTAGSGVTSIGSARLL